MTLRKRPVIGILGSGNQGYPELAVPLAQWVAQHDYHLLTGGGAGVMTTAAPAFCQVEPRDRA